MKVLPEKTKFDMNKNLRTVAVALGFAGVAGLASFAVIGQNRPPNIQKLNIASVPLYAATQGDKPALALALSVEYPTVGAQYVDKPYTRTDSSYSPAIEYIGYYNAEMCYVYRDSPAESPSAGKNTSDYKRFAISGPANGRQCADAFSGNFLNWASGSAIDMLRLALSGGDRIVDEKNLTVLQRAVLPDNSLSDGPGCFWNSNNFPAKELKKAGGGYFGAVPQAMIKAANGAESIWVANILNRMYFGTAQGGGCNNTGGYNLSSIVYANGMGPVSSILPGSAFSGTGNACANENGTCSTGGGIRQVWYGDASKGWVTAPVSGTFSCSNTAFGKDPAHYVVKKCYLTDYVGSWRPSVSKAGLNSDGFFYARTEVCAKDNSGKLIDERDYNFCEKYPNGNYKPVGVIQRYNNQLRLAAFGYAIENTLSFNNKTQKNGRYGGVLRAPMKFVGPRLYDENGQEVGPNPRAEWDQYTGIFHQNPENDGLGNSGVINYLNKFGRLLPNRQGNYKVYDPAGELYYEVLRYMQGLHPSPAAVSNLTSNMYDGFPIYTDWTSLDPYADRSNTADYSCVKSNIALIGDVNTHDSKSYGKSRMPNVDVKNNVPDIDHWLKVVQSFESGQRFSYVNGVDKDGNNIIRTTNNPNPASYTGYPDKQDRYRSSEIIGLSYWAHTHDIRGKAWTENPAKQRPGLRVKTFLFDVNEYGNETVNDKRRTNNQYYTAAKYGGYNTQPNLKDRVLAYNTEGNPFYNQEGRADNNVWQDQDPVRQLEPQSYFLQSNARSVLAAFEKIFSEAASALDSIAGSSASGSNLANTDLYQYRASFDTNDWSGDVKAYAIKSNSGKPAIEKNSVWSAEEKLRAMASAQRKIFIGRQRTTRKPNPTGSVATAFTAAEIDADLRDMLNKPSPSSAADGLWQDRVEYLRGGKKDEGSLFRVRSRAMGDIVNSAVVYMGSPSPTLISGEGYVQHVSARKNRVPAIYVGANDGMLHAFNAKTGEELFAYIPSWMGSKLSALSDPKYTHQSYVDATPVVGEAKTGKGIKKEDWKTVLVSGTGGGGKGVFALDVTNPDRFDANKVIWEFNQVNDPDMGHVIGKSRIVKMQVKHRKSAASKEEFRWFALVPAGANNYVDSGDGIYSSTGNSTIFLLALDKPVSEAWEQGKNYYKISLPFNSSVYHSGISGSVKATGIINLESFSNNLKNSIDLVYAGDLHGNVWALDFRGQDADNWNFDALSRYKASNGDAIPMYVAKDALGTVQSITSSPSILRIGVDNTYVVGVGTGKYIEFADAKDPQANTYHVLYDNGDTNKSRTAPSASWQAGIAGRGRLQNLNLSGSEFFANVGFRFGRPTNDSDASSRAGWYYDFPGVGERVISDGVAIPFTSTVVFSSITPDAVSSSGICSVDGGTSNTYTVDYFSAKGSVYVSTVGIVGQPLVFFSEGKLGKADPTGQRTSKTETHITQVGTKGIQSFAGPSPNPRRGRLSWRQINNYLELRNQP